MRRFLVCFLLVISISCTQKKFVKSLLKKDTNISIYKYPIYVAGDTMRFIFYGSSISNLVYQLDCLSGLIRCSKRSFQTLWKESLSWNETDQKQVEKWRLLRAPYQQESIRLAPLSSYEFPVSEKQIHFSQKIRIAGLRAQNIKEYQNNLLLLMTPEDVENTLQIITNFQARFDRWWQQKGETQINGFIRNIKVLFEEQSILPLVESFAGLLGIKLSTGGEFYFSFISNPSLSGASSGEQLENHAVVEVLLNESAEERSDVILHELVHYLFENTTTPPVKTFLTEKNTNSLAAYNLLNESLATALQAIVYKKLRTKEEFKKRLTRSGGFFQDRDIDAVAKAMIPLLEEMLQKKLSIDHAEFVPRYLALTEKTLGESLSKPRFRLLTMALIYEGDFFAPLIRLLRKNLRAQYVLSFRQIGSPQAKERLDRYSQMSAVMMIPTQKLSKLSIWQDFLDDDVQKEIETLSKTHAGYIYAVERSEKASIYFLIANDEKSFEKLIELFLTIDKKLVGLGPVISMTEFEK